MKTINCFNIIAAGLLLMSGSCQQDNVVEFGDCNLENVVKSVSGTKGIVLYDTQVKAYCIFTGIAGTYDSQIIGIVCNQLPDMYKAEGVKVLYSGNYYDCKEFPPRMPGQEYYYLELTKINSDSKQ